MRSYERSGLQVDQCSDCRGVFLDRGELERLIDAEGAYYERVQSGGGDARRSEHREEHRDEHRQEQRGGSLSEMGGLGELLGGKHRGGSHSHGHRKKKKESFLSDLFD
jgi:Zn-finger nucleic acid-binding protein